MSSEGDSTGSNTYGTSGGDNRGDATSNQRVSQQRPNQQHHRQQRDHQNQQQQQQRHQQQVNSASLGTSSHGAGSGYSGTGLHLAATSAQLHQQLSLLREGGWLGSGQSLSQLGLPFSAYGPIMNNHAFNRGGEGLHQQFFHSSNASVRRSQLEEIAADSSTNRYQNATNLMQGQSMAGLSPGNMMSSAGTNSSLARNVAMLQHQLNSMGQPISILGSGGAPLAAMSPEAFAANMQAMNNMGQHFSSFGPSNGMTPSASSNSINASKMQQLSAALSPNPSPFTGVSTRNLGRAEGVTNHPASLSVVSSGTGNSGAITHGAMPQCQGGSNNSHEPARKGAHPLNAKAVRNLPQTQRVKTSTKPALKSQMNPKRHSSPTQIRQQEPKRYIERDKALSTSDITAESKPINVTNITSPLRSGFANVVPSRGQAISREGDSMIHVPTPATAPSSKAAAEETLQCHPSTAQQPLATTAISRKTTYTLATKATTPVREVCAEENAPSPVRKAPDSITAIRVATTPVAMDHRNENNAADPSHVINPPWTSKKVEPKTPSSVPAATGHSLGAPKASPKQSEKLMSKASNKLTSKVENLSADPSKTNDNIIDLAWAPTKQGEIERAAHTFLKNDNPVMKSLPVTGATYEKTAVRAEVRKSQVDDYDPTHPIADLTVAAATNDILALLQLYGPLTYSQLKFNIATQLDTQQQGEHEKHDDLQEILDTLIELGVIHSVDTSPIASTISSIAEDADITYCFGRGIPRMDVILPCDLLDKLCVAGDEVLRARERISLLRTALLEKDELIHDELEEDESENTTNRKLISRKRKRNDEDECQISTRNLLNQLSQNYPEIILDPVFAEALCMCNVDSASENLGTRLNDQGEATINDNGDNDALEKSETSATRPSSSSVSSSSGGGTKKRKKGRPPKSSHVNTSNSGTDVTFIDRRSSGSPVSEVNS